MADTQKTGKTTKATGAKTTKAVKATKTATAIKTTKATRTAKSKPVAKTPLEMVHETQKTLNDNLAHARGQQPRAESTKDVEERRTDTTTETPGSIGGSGQDANPAHHPQRRQG